MSLMLRSFEANGTHYAEGIRWMGLDRRRALTTDDVARFAWALRADVHDVRPRLVLLERHGGRWVHLAGQRLSRWLAPTTMMAKLCPVCLRQAGWARISWMTRAVPACHRHGCSLLRECAHCGRPVRWARPTLLVCPCGRLFTAREEGATMEPELSAWLGWAEAVLDGDGPTTQAAKDALPALLHDLTLDGAYRVLEAFGLQKAPGDPVRDIRHGSARPAEVGQMLVRGLRRLTDPGRLQDLKPETFDVVHLPVLEELARDPSSEVDGQRATWLLDLHRASRPAGVRRVGTRPRRQMPLFI